jgi:hypothetical protein
VPKCAPGHTAASQRAGARCLSHQLYIGCGLGGPRLSLQCGAAPPHQSKRFQPQALQPQALQTVIVRPGAGQLSTASLHTTAAHNQQRLPGPPCWNAPRGAQGGLPSIISSWRPHSNLQVGNRPRSLMQAVEKCGTRRFWKGSISVGCCRVHYALLSYAERPPRRTHEWNLLLCDVPYSPAD